MMATPNSMIVFLEPDWIAVLNIMSALAMSAKRRLNAGTIIEVGKNGIVFVKVPAKTIAQLAPSTAADEMPRVKGLAKGLFNPV
ncbi:hypothetical protein NBRC116602_17590 [Hyphomicrobiales bacterium 4NK60-0047b]